MNTLPEQQLRAALQNLLDNVEQMRGLFDDGDGTIAAAINDANDALSQPDSAVSFIQNLALTRITEDGVAEDGTPIPGGDEDFDLTGDDEASIMTEAVNDARALIGLDAPEVAHA